MGMTIEQARIALGKERKYALHENKQAFDIAIDTMRKYQKIEEIYDNWNVDFGVETHRAMSKIGEVLEDGNDD